MEVRVTVTVETDADRETAEQALRDLLFAEQYDQTVDVVAVEFG